LVKDPVDLTKVFTNYYLPALPAATMPATQAASK
jgi:hypothetical protein